MASENLQIDENDRNVLGAITNNVAEDIKNLRVNPTTGRLLVDAVIGSTNTNIGGTIAGGTAGSILFLGLGSTLAEDNANLFYDDTNNWVGLGTNTPSATLDVVGTFQYVDGNQSNGYVLTSDGSGNATWQNNPAGTGYDTFQNVGVSVTQRNIVNLTNLLTATDVGAKTELTVNGTNLANNATFYTALINNSTYTTNLANNTNFVNTLTSNSTFITNLSTSTTITVAGTGIQVNQVAHGLVVGNIIRVSGANTYVVAQANSIVNAEVVGYVTVVTDANNFTFITEGIVTAGVPAQAAGTIMYLDPAVAGNLVTTSTGTTGQVNKPLLEIIQNATRAYFHIPSIVPVMLTGGTGTTGTLPISVGGTGATSFTSYGVVCGGTASTNPLQSISVGTTGQALVSAGAGALPAFGTLPVAGGGTGATTFTDGGVLIGNITGAIQVTTAGTAGQVLTSNGAGVDPTFQVPSGGTGTAIVQSIAQTTHGFSVGNVIRSSGVAGQYTKAQANTPANAEVIGIVTTVTDANNFIVTTEGYFTTGVPAQAAGTIMFLDNVTAGGLITTAPSTGTTVNKPLVTIITNAAIGYFHNYRGQNNQTVTVAASLYTVNADENVTTWFTSQVQAPFLGGSATESFWTLSGNWTQFTNGASIAGNGVDLYANAIPMDILNGGSNASFDFGATTIVRLKCSVGMPAGTDVSGGGSQRTGWFGFTGTVSAAGQINGDITVLTKRVGFGFYNGLIYAICATGAAITATSLGAYTANANKLYEIVLNGTTNALFYINGVLATTTSTNLPSSSNAFLDIAWRNTTTGSYEIKTSNFVFGQQL